MYCVVLLHRRRTFAACLQVLIFYRSLPEKMGIASCIGGSCLFVCVCMSVCVCVCANALSQLGRNFYPFDVYCRQVITWSNNAHTCQNTNRRCLRGLRFLSHCTSCTRVLAMLKIQLVSLAARWCIQAHSADVGWRCCFATACKETAPPCSGPAKLESSIGSRTTRDSKQRWMP